MDKRTLFTSVFALALALNIQAQEPRYVLRGDYPDPSIIRDGKDYYMTHSPFYYMPGFLIWHSTDLEHWQPVGRALSTWKGSAMAPDLVKHKGKYYIYYPADGTIWVTWAKDIRGSWSEPVDLKMHSIDPGHIATPKGKRYLYTSAGYAAELSKDGLSTQTKQAKVYGGWEYPDSWETECMCLESPKLFRHGDFYYMVSAEGGTAGPATSHMAVVARSKDVLGPWENSPYNPLVHTYSADETWWSKGHATLIDDVNGQWWMVYHSYEKGAYTLGRQTLIDPIAWTDDGWPVLDKSERRPLSGNTTPQKISISDDFSGTEQGWQWTFWKEYAPESISFSNGLTIRGKGDTPGNGRKLLATAMDKEYTAQVSVRIGDQASGGLVLFYDEDAYTGITTDGDNFLIHINGNKVESMRNKFGRSCMLKIVNRSGQLTFLASKDGDKWDVIRNYVDASSLHHNNYHGFYALRVGLLSMGQGECTFKDFIYESQGNSL